MTEFYLGTQAEMEALDSVISTNCGWPSKGTTQWAIPRETVTQDVFAIPVPQGSHGFTKEQMNAGVDGEVTLSTYEELFPPEE